MKCSYCCSSLVFLVSAFLSTSAVFASEAQWIEIQSPHFSVISDAGERRGREVAIRFEQMRAVFSALVAKANVNLPIPLQIVAFRNSKELRQVVPMWHGKPIQVAGLFQGGEDRSFIMLDMSVENPWTVVFHEYAHQLLSGNLTGHLDPWFEEGFAEYFSSIEVDGKQARVGKIPADNYQILRQTGLMKVADLLRVQQNSSTYNESGDHRTILYVQSSMLVHYLYDNGLIPKVAAYFTLKVEKNLSVEDAIHQAFGVSAAQLDKTLREYISTGRYKYYALPTPADIVEKGYTVRPLTVLYASTVIADIRLHSLDYRDKAAGEFQKILKTDPNSAAACRGLGYAYLQKSDFKQAGDYFKRAAQADSKDPRVHYYSALLMSREGSFGNLDELPEMTKELQIAISLDPNFADAYTLLAFALAQSGDPAKGLADMKKAVSLSPRNENYQFNLAQMYLNDQQVDQAIAILKVLSKSSDPGVAQRAAASLSQAQELKVALDRSPGITVNPAPREVSAIPREAPESSSPAPDPSAIKFVKGTVVSVDCSAAPSAILTVMSGTKTWKMRVADNKHVLVLGADGFSCGWKKQKVAMNYRETSDGAGTVVSIEVQ
jgi:tetratricopeptide (TPR) repeat protein